MKIKKIEKKEEIHNFLKLYNASATRQISDRVGNLEKYSEKLYRYAENFGMYVDDVVIGFFSFYNNNIKEKKAYLTIIAVKKEYRRMKFGSQAMHFIYLECQKKQMEKICLEVDKDNEKAYMFYKKEGFEILGNASECSIYMQKEI